MTRDRIRRLAVPATIVVVAGLVRLVALGHPDDIVFDETYYVSDARSYLAHGVESGFAVHPPVGKWLIALGMAIAGDTPLGWRIIAALAGTGIVLVTWAMARRLLPGVGAAALAGLLVAVDGLLVVQSRIAMLDVFLALFVVLGAWLVLVDRDRVDAVEHPPPVLARPALLGAGALLGLAVATKWSGILALGAAGLFVLATEVAARHRRGETRVRSAGYASATLAVALVLVPAAAYAASHVPWLAGYPATHEARTSDCLEDGRVLDPCAVGVGDRVRGAARHHVAVWRYHRDLEAEHPYKSRAWTWPLMIRPIVYHWESCPEEGRTEDEDPCVVAQGNAREIIALGNPALWWTAPFALLGLVAFAARRDRRAWFLLAFWLVQYAPWLTVERPLFFFYMTPVVPFMALGVAYAASRLHGWRPRVGLVAGVGVAVAALALFAYFLPLLVAWELPAGTIRDRWWFDSWV